MLDLRADCVSEEQAERTCLDRGSGNSHSCCQTSQVDARVRTKGSVNDVSFFPFKERPGTLLLTPLPDQCSGRLWKSPAFRGWQVLSQNKIPPLHESRHFYYIAKIAKATRSQQRFVKRCGRSNAQQRLRKRYGSFPAKLSSKRVHE